MRGSSAALIAAISMASVALVGTACRKQPPAAIEVAATPTIAESGLAQMLLATFERQTGVKHHLRVVSEDEAIRLANARSVQVVLTSHRPGAAIYAGVARLAETFGHRDFAIFGPAGDPAVVRSAESVSTALRGIAARKARFCSAVDVPFIVMREQTLWTAANIDPKTLLHSYRCHGDELAVLREADQRGAYTLSEVLPAASAGTSLDIKPLLVRLPELHDEYSVVLVDHAPRIRRDKDAEWFVQWLMSYEGRDAIQNFRVDGVHRF